MSKTLLGPSHVFIGQQKKRKKKGEAKKGFPQSEIRAKTERGVVRPTPIQDPSDIIRVKRNEG